MNVRRPKRHIFEEKNGELFLPFCHTKTRFGKKKLNPFSPNFLQFSKKQLLTLFKLFCLYFKSKLSKIKSHRCRKMNIIYFPISCVFLWFFLAIFTEEKKRWRAFTIAIKRKKRVAIMKLFIPRFDNSVFCFETC